MHLQKKLFRLLASDLTESQLLTALRQLVLEHDCDRDFYSEPTLNIPPEGWVQQSLPLPVELSVYG